MLRIRNKLWLISDTHFGHRNIIKFQQRPESHETIMLSEWAKRVGEDDQILHLGDVWMKASNWRWSAIIARLPGEKFLIKGNHDIVDDKFYEWAGFKIIDPFVAESNKGVKVAFTHVPVTPKMWELDLRYTPTEILEGRAWDVNIHGHTHKNLHHPEDGFRFEGKKYINVCVEHTNLAPIRLGDVLPVF